jgi:hypothetical protein
MDFQSIALPTELLHRRPKIQLIVPPGGFTSQPSFESGAKIHPFLKYPTILKNYFTFRKNLKNET